MIEPLDAGVEHGLLLVNLEVVTGDDLDQLDLGDVDELLALDYLLEMFQNKGLCFVHQICTGMDLREAVDAETVGLVHVLVQELTARVPHRQDLQQVGGAEHALHVVLGDGDLAGVGVVQQPGDHARLHPVQRDHVLDRLREAGGEHGLSLVNE